MTAEQEISLKRLISIDSEIMHGTACFHGTRVPVQTLIDFLEAGDNITDFVAAFPYIPRQQVHDFLELSRDVSLH